MAGKSTKERILWWVEHPELGVAVVEAPDWPLATVAAAEWWGVPWSKVAARCEVKERAVLPRFTCADCGGIFYGRDGDRVRCNKCETIARQKAAEAKKNAARFWKEMWPKGAG